MFRGKKVDLIHGRATSADKRRAMQEWIDGDANRVRAILDNNKPIWTGEAVRTAIRASKRRNKKRTV